MSSQLWTIQNKTLTLALHPGQSRAWAAVARFIVMLAGTQGGKTSFLPWWLSREIQACGAGDYLAVTASYDLFKLKFLPAMRECFEHVLRWGRYWASDRVIELADPASGAFSARHADDRMWGRIILRSADTSGGLESTTARAAILDEAGLPTYTLESWRAILRRLALHLGRVCLGTTLYNLGWLKQQLYDRAPTDPSIAVIQFDSITNPAYPRAEYERARRDLPLSEFNMKYRGRFERPAGQIYDNFTPSRHQCPRFAIPPTWPRFWGLDFGGVHTAALKFAQDPGAPPERPRYYGYSEYLAGGRTAAEHVAALLAGEPHTAEGAPLRPQAVYGGAQSEDQWRAEFAAAGLPIFPPDQPNVEVGIQRGYGLLARDAVVFFDDLPGVCDQFQSYARKLDSSGEPTEEIADKASYHYLDAYRYLAQALAEAPAVAYGPEDYPFR